LNDYLNEINYIWVTIIAYVFPQLKIEFWNGKKAQTICL